MTQILPSASLREKDLHRFFSTNISVHKSLAKYNYFYKKIVMLKIEHLGIAVKNIAESNLLFEKLLNTSSYKMEEVKSEGVLTSFFKVGENKIELLEATNPDSPIAKFIDKKGEGIHHIAFDVADIRAEMKRLKDEGFVLLNEEPKQGADNKLVCFLHPKGTNGVLIELCQERVDE
jgi:methylmalonyl-CoA/ethylmalonyl-CoA epimerase